MRIISGPVVACAILMPPGDPIVGVRDSKQLAPTTHERLADLIRTQARGWAVASASVAQVHFARLHNGHNVAVKVLRPGMERIVNHDIDLLDTFAQLIERFSDDGRRLKKRRTWSETRSPMKLTTRWTRERFHLLSTDGRHEVRMDTRAPLGDDSNMTPKQLVVAGLAGCTLMDVVALMRKHHQPVELLEVEAEVEKSTRGYPEVDRKSVV